MIFDFALRKDQEYHSHTLHWLFDNAAKAKRTGRTYLLATTFIRRAMEGPGLWVQIWDHRYIDDLVCEIKNILAGKDLINNFNLTHRGELWYIRFNAPPAGGSN